MSFTVRGVLEDIGKLGATNATTGDTYFVGGSMYTWDGSQWNSMGSVQGPQGMAGFGKNYDLTYKGITVTVLAVEDITTLFLDPDNLDQDDLAIFETTFPNEYREFEEIWSQARAKQIANNEINEWREAYGSSRAASDPQ